MKNVVNDITDKLNKHIEDSLYQEAGGTATAITLSMQTLKNGYSKTFIATTNNNGSATTINGKPLYKPGTTTAPSIKEGKAYTVWYNSVSDCFFLQASAEGNVGAEHVLAGYTFSNDDDTGLAGAMPNNTGTNKELSLNETWVIPKGYHDGNGRVTQNIPNRGESQNAGGFGEGGDYYSMNNIPYGYYPQSNNGWAPEIRISKDTVRNHLGITADKIVSGQSIAGVAGNATVQHFARGTLASSTTNNINLGFVPRMVIIVRMFSDGSNHVQDTYIEGLGYQRVKVNGTTFSYVTGGYSYEYFAM